MNKFLVFFIVAISLCISGAQSQEEKEECGKVIGLIVDEKTLEPVNEEFNIFVYDSLDKSFNSNSLKYKYKSDKFGRFRFMIKPGIYYLQFLPESILSNYEMEPSPLITVRKLNQIMVSKGRICRFHKIAYFGGNLKIVLMNTQGSIFNPRQFLSGSEIDATVIGEKLIGFIPGFEDESVVNLADRYKNLNDGETYIKRLPEGEYKIEVSFGYCGYGDKRIENIKIIKNETTTCSILVDLNDNTGIVGRVLNEAGEPLKDLIVEMKLKSNSCCSGTNKTDTNGNYKIIGLLEGVYELSVSSEYGKVDNIIFKYFGELNVYKDKILQKNLIFKKD